MKVLVKSFIDTLLLVLFWNIASVSAAVPKSPSNCRLQNSYSSLGIDTKTPRFSWAINDKDRGEKHSMDSLFKAISKKISSAWLYISGLGQSNSYLNCGLLHVDKPIT